MVSIAHSYMAMVFLKFKSVVDNKILFEDHYFCRLLAFNVNYQNVTWMSFTLEYLKGQILALVNQTKIQDSFRVWTVFRNEGGFYLPSDNSVSSIMLV
jgi:branched-chain amino acid aminotransferase